MSERRDACLLFGDVHVEDAAAVGANDLARLPEQKDAVGGGDVELESLRPVLDQLRKQLQHRCRYLCTRFQVCLNSSLVLT